MTVLAKEEQQRICRVYLETNSEKETARITKHSIATVSKYLIRYGLGRGIGGNQDRQRKITDEQILSGISSGMTRQEIADLYGVHVENLARRIKRLGVHAKYAEVKPRVIFGDTWHYVEWHKKRCDEQHPNFEYIESRKNPDRVRLKCRTCGCVIERAVSTFRENGILCDSCEEKRKLSESRFALLATFLAIKDYKTPKTCKACGGVFYSANHDQLYCSKKCKRKAKANSIRRRCKRYGVYYDSTVTRQKVFERDGYICQICGKPTDPGDTSWGHFGPFSPTIDHIIALKNGGAHTWGNVQCAHAICNSYKRDLLAVEMEVS